MLSYPRFEIHYNSDTIDFSEWLSLITLSLAPLIAHIWAGVPKAAILSGPDAKWHDRMTHLNPTSIIWRYYAITLRRLRSQKWDHYLLAANNTAFLVDGKWTGTREMIRKSRRLYLAPPEKARVRSESFLKTLIISLQGVQAIWEFTIGVRDERSGAWAVNVSLPTAFEPFAVLGLVRLFAAWWLYDEGAYLDEREFNRIHDQLVAEAGEGSALMTKTTSAVERIVAYNSTTEVMTLGDLDLGPSKWWRKIMAFLLTIFYLIYVLFFVAISCFYIVQVIVPSKEENYYTGTTFALNLLYLVFFGVTFALCFWYMLVNGKEGDTTVIPCINSVWYKAYTLALALLAVIAVAFGCVETNRVKCTGSTMETYAPYGHPNVSSVLQNLDECLIRPKVVGLNGFGPAPSVALDPSPDIGYLNTSYFYVQCNFTVDGS